MRVIFDTVYDAVIIIREGSSVAGWNKAAEDIFGWKAKEAVGANLIDLIIPKELKDAYLKGIQRFLSTGNPTILGSIIEINAKTKKGKSVSIELTVSAAEWE